MERNGVKINNSCARFGLDNLYADLSNFSVSLKVHLIISRCLIDETPVITWPWLYAKAVAYFQKRNFISFDKCFA